MSHTHEEVLGFRLWTDTLFSLRTTRDPSFRFQCGQFTMIGLQVDGRPLMRAYSLVSAAYDEVLEFLSIKVQDGPFTRRLQHIASGEKLIIGKKATGTLVLGNLLPGRNLYLLGTGTGLAPLMSIIRNGYLRDGLYRCETYRPRGRFAKLSIRWRDTEPQNAAMPCSSWLP